METNTEVKAVNEYDKLKLELNAMYALNKEGWGKVEHFEKQCDKLKSDNEVLLNALKQTRNFIFNRLVFEQMKDGCSKGYSEDYVKRQNIIIISDEAIKQVESK